MISPSFNAMSQTTSRASQATSRVSQSKNVKKDGPLPINLSTVSVSYGNIPPSTVMAITEGRGVAIEVGICVFNTSSCECALYQVCKEKGYRTHLY
jgi:hypothetical protein